MTGLLGIQPTAMLSGSMKPTMDVGDMAIVRDVPTNSIEVGDIIQYWNDGEMVIHRVVEVRNGGNGGRFITQGDANDKPDIEPVHSGQVKGEVILTIPELGWLPIGVKAFVGGAWSFVSANPMVMVLIISFGVCVFYLYKTRSSRSWRAPKWKKKARVGGKIVPLLALLLVGTAASGLAYSCWSDSIYINGTVTSGSWGVEKTFRLTVKYCVQLGDVTYYGAVKPDGHWESVELTLESHMHLCKDKIYTGTISGLPPGTYEWKIYYVDNSGENHLIVSDTENLLDPVTLNEYTLGCTCLCVRKTVRCHTAQHESGSIYRIEGKIKVWNLGWYPAIVVDVSDTILYKLPGSWWKSLSPISFDHDVPEIIPWGYHEYTYTCRFSTENILPLGGHGPLCKPSWRNLIEITISNYPWGMHTFSDDVWFKLEDK
jgi:signal peptidase I